MVRFNVKLIYSGAPLSFFQRFSCVNHLSTQKHKTAFSNQSMSLRLSLIEENPLPMQLMRKALVITYILVLFLGYIEQDVNRGVKLC